MTSSVVCCPPKHILERNAHCSQRFVRIKCIFPLPNYIGLWNSSCEPCWWRGGLCSPGQNVMCVIYTEFCDSPPPPPSPRLEEALVFLCCPGFLSLILPRALKCAIQGSAFPACSLRRDCDFCIFSIVMGTWALMNNYLLKRVGNPLMLSNSDCMIYPQH